LKDSVLIPEFSVPDRLLVVSSSETMADLA